MAYSDISSSAPPPTDAWDSLVSRSIEALKTLARNVQGINMPLVIECLRRYSCVDDFLYEAPNSLMFWFFQRRDAFQLQGKMKKWSRDVLDDYVLLSTAPGFVRRNDCFFVSHFWRTQDHPDPDGECLRLLQAELQTQHWSYIWVDWSCMPQGPRSQAEEAYFIRSMETMSGLIRNCAFIWFYPPFEPRMWILYEVAQFALTSIGDLPATPDMRAFRDHIQEMVQTSVRSVLDKYSYKCTHDRDEAFLTSWLEVLVLLTRLRIGIFGIRELMDHMTWHSMANGICAFTADGVLELRKFQGTLIRGRECYTFTPFPKWDVGKYSSKHHGLLRSSDR